MELNRTESATSAAEEQGEPPSYHDTTNGERLFVRIGKRGEGLDITTCDVICIPIRISFDELWDLMTRRLYPLRGRTAVLSTKGMSITAHWDPIHLGKKDPYNKTTISERNIADVLGLMALRPGQDIMLFG